MTEILKYQIKIVDKPADIWLDQAVRLINAYAEEGLMLEQTVESLSGMAEAGWLALALTEEGDQVLGVAGLTAWSSGILEFGAWAVEREWVNQGIGKELMAEVLKTVADDQPVITFGNQENSGPIFERMGLEKLDQTKLPDELFEPCQTCNCDKSNLGSGQRCVDTVFAVNGYFKE
jgi:N-acetylglutamate synthase-like GNAT family acetyltransferase